MIRGFLFDYDGVMTNNNQANTPPSEKLEAILGLPGEEVNLIFSSLWPGYLRGKITDKELWQQIEVQSGQSIPLEKRDIWSKWEQLKPLPEMIELIASLKTGGFTVGLLTNVTPTTEQEVRQGGGYQGFDFWIKSCEIGFAKPDVEIYNLALQQFEGLTPEEIVFTDDRKRFLIPAQKLGMQTILSSSSAQVIKDIRTLLRK